MDRWRWLRKHPLHEEIDLRLRHWWTGGDVSEWIRRENPQHPAVDAVLLDRYAQEQPPGWRVPVLVDRSPGRRAARMLALEEHTEVVRVQLERCRTFLTVEQGMQLPVPEVRANLELLGRLLSEQVKLQQELGYLPRRPNVAVVATGDVSRARPEDDLVRKLVAMPSTLFYGEGGVADELLGPPPPPQSLPREAP